MTSSLTHDCFPPFFPHHIIGSPRLIPSVRLPFNVSLVRSLVRRLPTMQQELLTLHEHLGSLLFFSGVRVARSLVACRSLFELLTFSFWSLFCLSICDVQFQITPLISSNFSLTFNMLPLSKETDL